VPIRGHVEDPEVIEDKHKLKPPRISYFGALNVLEENLLGFPNLPLLLEFVGSCEITGKIGPPHRRRLKTMTQLARE
jgi:hypothetical protein